jgi:hypothetical protein
MMYSFLNLSREASLPEFSLNYKLETAEVYVKLTLLFWRRNELLDIIYKAGVGYSRIFERIPSWVQDLEQFVRIPSLRHARSFYRA